MFLEKENQGFFESAKNGLNETWRYIVGSILIFFGWQTVASAPLWVLIGYIILKKGNLTLLKNGHIAQAGMEVGVSKNVTLAIILSTFMLACIGVYVVVKFLHKRKFKTMLTSRPLFSWKRAFVGFALWLLYATVSLAISYQLTPENFIFSFDAMTFLPLLIICIILLPFQTSFEEFLFRGYLTQGVGIVTGSQILAILLPAIAFGLLHGLNPEVFTYGFWTMMPFYIGMGVFLGILAVMDDGLELPLGIHFANNFSAAVLVSIKSAALPTTPLFTIKNYNPTDEVLSGVIIMFVFVILFSFIFKWDWKKLFEKI